jgi:DNA primase
MLPAAQSHSPEESSGTAMSRGRSTSIRRKRPFKKSETLYGFDKAKSSVRTYNFSILVEGQMDLLMTHQAGFTNAVASMGTAISPFHVERLKRLSGNMVIALDADDAGVASALKAAKVAMKAGMDVKLAALPEGKDPADVVLEDKEKWREGIRTASHVIEFLLARILSRESDARKAKLRVTRELLPYVALIGNGIDQSHFVAKIASAIGVEQTVVESEVRKLPLDDMDMPSEAQEEAPEAFGKHDRLSRILTGILLWQEKAEAPAVDVENLRSELLRILGQAPETLYPEGDRDAIAFEAEVGYQDSAHIERHIKEMLNSLEEHFLKEELSGIMAKLLHAEREGRQDEAAELLVKCTDVTKRLNTLQQNTL